MTIPAVLSAATTWHIETGDCLAVLRSMPDACAQCVVTSPPYWGLRDYGLPPSVWGGTLDCEHEWQGEVRIDKRGLQTTPSGTLAGPQREDARCSARGQFCSKCNAWLGCFGLEPTPQLYVEHAVELFAEVRRVLRDDGTCFLNLGDSYAGSWGNYSGQNRGAGKQRTIVNGSAVPNPAYDGLEGYRPAASLKHPGLKPKDLIGIPWLTAFALRDAGWYLRSAMPWVKRAAMPESVQDRPASALEYVFVLAKSQRYYFDMDAVRREASPASIARIQQPTFSEQEGGEKDYANGTNANRSIRKTLENFAENPGRNWRNADLWFQSVSAPHGMVFCDDEPVGVDVSTKGFPGAHFATFPESLVEPCIMAGTSEEGCCAECGAPLTRVVERELVPTKKAAKTFIIDERDRSADANDQGSNRQKDGHKNGHIYRTETTGWMHGCDCNAGTVPCVVLDPFSGAGTTAMVARKLGRRAIGIELNPVYADMGRARAANRNGVRGVKPLEGQRELFT